MLSRILKKILPTNDRGGAIEDQRKNSRQTAPSLIADTIYSTLCEDDTETLIKLIKEKKITKNERIESASLGQVPLIAHAAAHGAINIAKYLIDQKVEVAPRAKDQENVLTAACYAKLLENPYTPSTNDPNSKAAVEIARIFVTMININAQNQNGDTPLHLAVSFNFYQMAAFLFENNASFDQKNNNNETPFSQITLCDSVPQERKKIVDLYLSRILEGVGIFKCLHPTIQEYVHEESVNRYDLGEMGYSPPELMG